MLEGVGVSPKNIRDQVDAALAQLPQVYGDDRPAAPQISPDAYKLLEAADEERRDLGDDYLSTEHLLLAMTKVARRRRRPAARPRASPPRRCSTR